ncbi:MAG TPA: amidohydrolase family protein [Bacteroidales bacterium]|nr:hypothetical protein [Bacteroidales bacterium]HQG37080.1 amidohydrolase family protein [Bacteroidales bacterium]HQG52425.1 amidohydrolase family protein [Bacteroidales bacterium]HQJ20076.1 amidohydrolase family protein [Bacteroidales bacterium]HRC89063.1 amidohydrolase family protein [Bacteroidales bacterium]
MLKFYDIHYHLFDLSHPNLIAFLLRDDMITRESVKKVAGKLPFLMNFVPAGVVKFLPQLIAEKIKEYIRDDAVTLRNLLALMENAVEYHFLLADYYLRKEVISQQGDNTLSFNKIVLCPLLIDFGYKSLRNSGCYYDLPPAKPIAGQVADLLNAIRFYYSYDIIGHPVKQGQLKLIKTNCKKEDKLFEIYPFLGINTRNYDLLEIKSLIDKYFPGYENDESPADRYNKLYSKLGTINVSLEDLIFKIKEKKDPEYYSYIFAGIKLYPPLGFDPWPEDEPDELDKVKFLYSECVRKKIPLTVHCSDGGFKTTPEAFRHTNPERWIKVLNNSSFKNLKINFAHMGSMAGGNDKWLQTIMKLISKYDNVYTDFSFITPKPDNYERIKKIINNKSLTRLLFGSDFIINLLRSGSYNEYISAFLTTPYLTSDQKADICNNNPEKFLFG